MTSFSISTTGSAQTEKLGSSRDRTQDHGMLRFTTVPSIDRGICNDTPPWAVILGFVQYVCYMEKCLVVALGSMSHTLCSSIYHLLTLWPLSEPIRASKVAVPGPEWRCQALSGGAGPWVAVPGPEPHRSRCRHRKTHFVNYLEKVKSDKTTGISWKWERVAGIFPTTFHREKG